MKKDMKIARYELKVVYKKELILTMEDDVDSEELLKIFLETQLKEEKERTEEIKEFEKYAGTDAYIEDVAKDKLGLIHKNEILFEPEP